LRKWFGNKRDFEKGERENIIRDRKNGRQRRKKERQRMRRREFKKVRQKVIEKAIQISESNR
jgi:hypothetical protein